MTAEPISDVSLDDLVACPVCDALNRVPHLEVGERGRCARCHDVLMAPQQHAMTHIVMLSATALILMAAAVFFPFLELDVGGQHQRSSVFDAVMSFAEGWLLPLSVAVAALIVVLPALRLLALIYVLAPMSLGWRPARYAVPVFRFSEDMKPWAMAEVFIVGVAVALVKVAGLAKVSTGPAFWAFVGLVLVTVLKDSFMCRLTIWKTLEDRSAP